MEKNSVVSSEFDEVATSMDGMKKIFHIKIIPYLRAGSNPEAGEFVQKMEGAFAEFDSIAFVVKEKKC